MDHLNNVVYHLGINDHEMGEWTRAATRNYVLDEHNIKRCADGTPTGLLRAVGSVRPEMLTGQYSARDGIAKGHYNGQDMPRNSNPVGGERRVAINSQKSKKYEHARLTSDSLKVR